TARGDDLVSIETERADITKRADMPAFIANANGLRGIFDHEQVEPFREFRYCVHSACQSQKMNGQNGANAAATRLVEAFICTDDAFVFKKTGHLQHIDLPIPGIDVDENGMSLAISNSVYRSDECQIWNENLVVRPYTDHSKCNMQGRGAV